MTDKIEAAAREAESKYEHRSPHWRLGFRTGYEEGYVSIRAEMAELRARLEAAEAKAAKWVYGQEAHRLEALGYVKGPEMIWHRGPGMVAAAWHYLMVPPVPLPETETKP